MGRLVQLELENFKSYSGKQIVGPFDNFTCIVGPNGAGKSNMMDAISFVLGVQSQHLRSSNLKELIFRKDASSAPARKSSVKLVYELSDGEVQHMKSGDQINFSRSISATGVSTYRLDDKEVTFAVYEEMLQKIGVLVKARNFLVFQGDVESVASKSPMELCRLLEQICGSDSLRSQYDELQRSKIEAEENTLFSMQKKKMFSTQQKEVREQKEEAEIFQRKQQHRDELKTEHILWKIFRIKSSIEMHQERADEYLEEEEEARLKEAELDEEMQRGKQRLAKLTKSLLTAEKEVQTQEKVLKSIAPQLYETRDKIKRLESRLVDLEKAKSRLTLDKEEQGSNLIALKEEIESLKKIKASLETQFQAAGDKGLQLTPKQLEQYGRLKEEAAVTTASLRAEQQTNSHDMASKRAQASNLQTQEESIRREIESGDRMCAEYQTRLGRLALVIAATEKERDATSKERDSSVIEMKSCIAKGEQLDTDLEKVTEKLREAGNERQRSKKEEKMSEAVENMKRIFVGVHGKLADLCRPIQKKYSTAVTVAAGKVMDHIVVDSKAVAGDCIRYLKDQRIGTCAFLPLDNIQAKPISDRLRSLGTTFRPCIDLIDCDERFTPAVSYAVGSTIICDTLDDARDLAFRQNERCKLVTLHGDMIGKSGAMTGGFVNLSNTDRWEEKEVEELRQKKARLEEEIAANKRATPSRQRLLDIETTVKTLQTRALFGSADSKVAEERIAQLVQRKRNLESSAREISRELAVLNSEILQLETIASGKAELIHNAEKSIFAAFSKECGVADVQEFEQARLRTHQDLVRKLTATSERVASMSAQLEYESRRDFTAAIQRIQQQMDEAKDVLIRLRRRETKMVTEETNTRAVVASATTKVQAVRGEQKNEATVVKDIFSRRSVANMEREIVAKKVSGEEIRVERLRAQLHEVLQKAHVDEVALPTVNIPGAGDGSESPSNASQSSGSSSSRRGKAGSEHDLIWTGSRSDSQRDQSSSSGDQRGSSSSRSVSASTHFSQSDNAVVVHDQRAVARVDLSSMDRYKTLTSAQKQEKEEGLARRLAEISLELEAMQPNMHAAERYAGVLDKLRDCSDDLEDQKETARRSAEQFELVRRQRRERFQECFNFVSKALGVIYKDLTRSSKHPLGGNAYLTLDNTDEPYLGGIRYTAMPPMKRFRDMDQLSGGEKTIAALALLFSIHSYRQAPFFVLDEVDAALDNVNVKKICNYMKQRSRDFQCIVISLKDMFFEHADSLVGVAKDVETLSSQVLRLDLKGYSATPEARPRGSLSGVAAEDQASFATLGTQDVGAGAAGGRGTPSPTGGSASKAAKGKRKAAMDLPDVLEEGEEEEA